MSTAKIATVAIPAFAHKGPHDTDAGMYRRAANNLDFGYPIGGGNVSRAISNLLTTVANAIEAQPINDEQAYDEACAEIFAEAVAARRQFPAFNSAHEGASVLREEFEAMWDEVKRDDLGAAITEAVQVGAMAIRFIADMRAKTMAEATMGARP